MFMSSINYCIIYFKAKVSSKVYYVYTKTLNTNLKRLLRLFRAGIRLKTCTFVYVLDDILCFLNLWVFNLIRAGIIFGLILLLPVL